VAYRQSGALAYPRNDSQPCNSRLSSGSWFNCDGSSVLTYCGIVLHMRRNLAHFYSVTVLCITAAQLRTRSPHPPTPARVPGLQRLSASAQSQFAVRAALSRTWRPHISSVRYMSSSYRNSAVQHAYSDLKISDSLLFLLRALRYEPPSFVSLRHEHGYQSLDGNQTQHTITDCSSRSQGHGVLEQWIAHHIPLYIATHAHCSLPL
jgi:hypothetical protein